MNSSLIVFIALTVIVVGLVAYFLRGALANASQHAKTYSVAYIKGGSLVLIAAGAAFDQGFQSLAAPIQASMQWAPYAIFFWKPIAAGLAVLVAFLDRSTQRATEEAKANTAAPFSPSQPRPVSP